MPATSLPRQPVARTLPTPRKRWQQTAWLLMWVAAVGCTRARPQPTYSVTGIVQWSDGRPATELIGGTIALKGKDGEGPRIPVSPHGEVLAEGKFELQTYAPGDGAPAGRYQVIVMPIQPRDDEVRRQQPILDARFQSYGTSPLELTVSAERNDVRLTVERIQTRGNTSSNP